ncbi:MAG: hypothetical protein GF365_05030 [Candidatus Buchananbacteria bacterium]|nr:hypothetical protein [Candidatus Buchananbacteria bacterium]
MKIVFFMVLCFSLLFVSFFYLSSSAKQKYFWGWNTLVAFSFCLSILLAIQTKIEPITILVIPQWFVLMANYLPLSLTIIAIYFMYKAAQYYKKNDFLHTHFKFIFAFSSICLAIVLPLINIFWTLQAAQSL